MTRHVNRIMAILALGAALATGMAEVAQAGQRILGQWTNGWWYPARVTSVRGGNYDLLFEDGDRLSVGRDGIGVFDWRQGSPVQCKRVGFKGYQDATVAMISGNDMLVGFTDGVHANTRTSDCRSGRAGGLSGSAGSGGSASTGYSYGQRVMAQWSNGWWYPARISGWNAEVYRVQFDDGDSAYLKPAQISGRLWRSGSRVQCKWQGGDKYYDGTIAAINGTSIRVNYDDGDREDTSFAWCRSRGSTKTTAKASPAPAPEVGDAVIGAIIGAFGEALAEGLSDSAPATSVPQPRAPASGYGVPSTVYDSARDVPSDPEAFLRAIENNSR